MSDDSDRGPVRADATPPVDALATVVVGGDAVTTVGVREGDRVAVHARDDGDKGLDGFAVEGDVPEPAGVDDVPDDATDSFVPTSRSWVTVVVADERVVRLTAAAGETVAIHLEPATGDIETAAGRFAGREPGGSRAEDGGSA